MASSCLHYFMRKDMKRTVEQVSCGFLPCFFHLQYGFRSVHLKERRWDTNEIQSQTPCYRCQEEHQKHLKNVYPCRTVYDINDSVAMTRTAARMLCKEMCECSVSPWYLSLWEGVTCCRDKCLWERERARKSKREREAWRWSTVDALCVTGTSWSPSQRASALPGSECQHNLLVYYYHIT